MEKKQIIKDLLKDFGNRLPQTVYQRQIILPIDSKKVISVIGARRSGKTFIMFDTIKRLMSNGVPKENIVFFSCEDERLQMDISEMDLIVQAYNELFPQIDLINTYWFFDEIQNVTGWEKFIRRIYDTISPNIYISGSNSKLLGTEIATSMRGRTLTFEVFPLSFSDYLSFQNIPKEYYGSIQKARIINSFYKYLNEGGFPEIVFAPDFFKTKTLQEYYHLMVYHDLVERYKIQNITALKYLLSRLMTSIGKPYPLNRVYNELKSKGIPISKNSLYEYLEHIQAVYLAFTLPKYDVSFIKQETAEKKLYWIDTGLLYSLFPVPSENKGLVFENVVYLFLRSNFGSFMYNNIFYFKGKSECDFIVFDRNKATHCIQVSYDISEPKTRAREIKGLLEALHFFKIDVGYIITHDYYEEYSIDNKQIVIKPAYKVFIDSKL